jgi:hypothetical protein
MENRGYIKELNYGNVTVVENRDYQWAVIDNQGNFVVPFGKYGWIDGFDSGLARVRTYTTPEQFREATAKFLNMSADRVGIVCATHNSVKGNNIIAKWGIINEMGEEVLPVEYDNIWNFYGKSRWSTKVEKDGYTTEVQFHDLNPSLPVHGSRSFRNDYEDYVEHGHYDEYAGTYAQEVMGYSDEDIDDIFDGDPDAYWNID